MLLFLKTQLLISEPGMWCCCITCASVNCRIGQAWSWQADLTMDEAEPTADCERQSNLCFVLEDIASSQLRDVP